ncbi:MAG: ATP-binding protein [Clostridiales bacterium]|nr:ATP-binding protein [Clostridiales bacterium]
MSVINKYYHRALESVVKESFKNNKVVSILGARQCGKSTLVENLYPDIDSVSLKTEFMIAQAKTNPDSFVRGLSIPAFIDEAQRAPEIFGSIQEIADRNPFYSQFILSGSNKQKLDDKIKESLAGRTSIIEMNGLSLREIFEIDFNHHFVPTPEYLNDRKKCLKECKDVWFYIHRGSYPELYDNPNKNWEEFYSSYVQTYIEKDVLTEIKLKNTTAFVRFLTACASRTGDVLSYTSIANDVGVSAVTVKEWISILVKTNIVYLLQPYYNSHLSRAIKSPKMYFRDTGLAAYLSGWLTRDQMERGARNGFFFETFVVNELIKSFSNEGKDYSKRLFFYNGKDKTKKKKGENGNIVETSIDSEIDFIIEENGVLYPIEIKKKDMPTVDDASAFDVLDKDIDKKRGMGVIFSSNPNKVYLRDDIVCLPVEYI